MNIPCKPMTLGVKQLCRMSKDWGTCPAVSISWGKVLVAILATRGRAGSRNVFSGVPFVEEGNKVSRRDDQSLRAVTVGRSPGMNSDFPKSLCHCPQL